MFRQVASQPFRFLRHRLVHLRHGETLCGVGVDAGDGIPKPEIVKPPVGVVELPAYLRQSIKGVADIFRVRERVPHGLFVVARRYELAFLCAAFGLFLSLISGKDHLLFVGMYIFIHLHCLFVLLGEHGYAALAVGCFLEHQVEVLLGYERGVVGYPASAERTLVY